MLLPLQNVCYLTSALNEYYLQRWRYVKLYSMVHHFTLQCTVFFHILTITFWEQSAISVPYTYVLTSRTNHFMAKLSQTLQYHPMTWHEHLAWLYVLCIANLNSAIVFSDDLLTPAVILIWVLSVQVPQLYIKLLEYNLKVFVYIIIVAIKMMNVLFVDKCTRNLSCWHFDWMLQSNQT